MSIYSYSQKQEIQYFTNKWEPVTDEKAKFVRHIEKVNDTLYSVIDYDKKGRIYMKGQYFSVKPMVENGFFEFYDFGTSYKTATGFYTQGIMTGDWTFYGFNSKITRKVNYDLKLIKNPKDVDEESKKDTVVLIIDEPPKFSNSNNIQAFAKYIGDSLIYPPMAQRYLIEGSIFLEFVINEKGQVSDIITKGKNNKDLEREAIRVVAQSPDWTPGYKKGKAVRVHFIFPINFKL